MIRPRARKVLVCGASIAGPALAWWLERYGFDVTVVERAGTIRSGGYAIDIRGTAVDVCERMGLMPALREEHINAQSWTFRNSRRVISSIRQEDITGGVVGRDVEVQRGVISGLLHDMTKGTIPYRFDDSVTAMADHDGGIDVTFRSGRQERFDLVIAADGLHSTTRALAFGPADQFYRYLGCCFVGFTMPNNHGFSREAVIYNEPGLMALVYETGAERMNALLAYRREAPAREEYTDMDRLHRNLQARYAGQGWIVPEMLSEARKSADIYFDSMTQIHMPQWSKGRVGVVGDAAYGPSFFSGQGTSLALVGAYVLAGELATHADHREAFAAYERKARAFVEQNQATAHGGSDIMVPATRAKIWKRNVMMDLSPILTRFGLIGRKSRQLNSALTITDYHAAGPVPTAA
jgi:2-polyprenyl-6-methoxyphenol hydroxylase-like FAD-dependent oxidoreductase